MYISWHDLICADTFVYASTGLSRFDCNKKASKTCAITVAADPALTQRINNSQLIMDLFFFNFYMVKTTTLNLMAEVGDVDWPIGLDNIAIFSSYGTVLWHLSKPQIHFNV